MVPHGILCSFCCTQLWVWHIPALCYTVHTDNSFKRPYVSLSLSHTHTHTHHSDADITQWFFRCHPCWHTEWVLKTTSTWPTYTIGRRKGQSLKVVLSCNTWSVGYFITGIRGWKIATMMNWCYSWAKGTPCLLLPPDRACTKFAESISLSTGELLPEQGKIKSRLSTELHIYYTARKSLCG